jgi:hypothetical protein
VSRTEENVEKVRLAALADSRQTTDEIYEIKRCGMEVMSTHFIGRCDDKNGCCKICAVSAHREAKKQACECLLQLAGTSSQKTLSFSQKL